MDRAGLRIVRAGPLVTVQDRGRLGAARYGVSWSGPMDWTAQAVALRLAGCSPNAPAIEAGPGGIVVACENAAVRIGLAGRNGIARIEGSAGSRAIPLPARIVLRPGERLNLRPLAGNWVTLAAKGLDVGPSTLDSHATNARTGLGPARPDVGTLLPCAPAEPEPDLPYLDPLVDAAGPVRIMPAPQTHLFDEVSLLRLVSEPFLVTPKRDRQGGRLQGPGLCAPGGHDIASDALVPGAMQVPGDGHPIVLTADCAPTGGYPKIAIVIRADLPRLAQTAAGMEIGFAWASESEARAALFALEDAVANPMPRRRQALPEAFLRGLRRSGA